MLIYNGCLRVIYGFVIGLAALIVCSCHNKTAEGTYIMDAERTVALKPSANELSKTFAVNAFKELQLGFVLDGSTIRLCKRGVAEPDGQPYQIKGDTLYVAGGLQPGHKFYINHDTLRNIAGVFVKKAA